MKPPATQTKKAKKAPTTQQIRAVQKAKKKVLEVEKRHGFSKATGTRYRKAKQEKKMTPPEFRLKRDTCLRESIRLLRRQKSSIHGKRITSKQVRDYYSKSYMSFVASWKRSGPRYLSL